MAGTRKMVKRSTAAGRMTPPLKMHGGKHYLANWIVGLMPEHHKYVELFAGGLAVLWAKNPNGVSEVVNDIHHELMNFYSVIRDEELFGKFMRHVTATPFGRPV
jgi:DNA adenine methylase